MALAPSLVFPREVFLLRWGLAYPLVLGSGVVGALPAADCSGWLLFSVGVGWLDVLLFNSIGCEVDCALLFGNVSYLVVGCWLVKCHVADFCMMVPVLKILAAASYSVDVGDGCSDLQLLYWLDGDSRGCFGGWCALDYLRRTEPLLVLWLVSRDPHPPGVVCPNWNAPLLLCLESELARDRVSYSPGPLDHDVNTPPSISRILEVLLPRLGLSRVAERGSGESGSTASPRSGDPRPRLRCEVKVAAISLDVDERFSAGGNGSLSAELMRDADSCAGTWADLIPCYEAVLAVAAALDVCLLDSLAVDDADELWILLSGLLAGAGFGTVCC
ncbi:hypothetical protein Nepgr_033594 [Nepenthes gracilis]|uniref:Uncharacterized protein n=1 Tax=Nepenthes gracilis TaxID=150966 RepID=A0AAD3TLG6_NEPGR|nr:hypothetical protein Nepgr_033594 [Nepenthes gracilis]